MTSARASAPKMTKLFLALLLAASVFGLTPGTGVSAATRLGGDTDADSVPDNVDNCVVDPNSNQADGDGDGRGDVCDNCPTDANPAGFWYEEQFETGAPGWTHATRGCLGQLAAREHPLLGWGSGQYDVRLER